MSADKPEKVLSQDLAETLSTFMGNLPTLDGEAVRHQLRHAHLVPDHTESIPMTIELTEADVQRIEDWYLASSGESAHSRDAEHFALLDKLDIHATERDLYFPNPEHTIEEARPSVIAEVEAIQAYRLRHPDYEEVIEAVRQNAEDGAWHP